MPSALNLVLLFGVLCGNIAVFLSIYKPIGDSNILNHTHESLGAVIIGGGFASLEVARNLDKYGVKVCLLGSDTSVARFSRSIGHFVKLPKGLKDEELLDFLIATAEKCHVRGWVLFSCIDEHLRILAQHSARLAEYFVVATPS